MYSSEIEKYLKDHNYILKWYDCVKIIDPIYNPQIQTVKFFSGNLEYNITTNDGYFFRFWVNE